MNIGRQLTGCCDGRFGRDDCFDKIIILEGRRWIVCKLIDSDMISSLNFRSEKEKNELVDKWSRVEKDEEEYD